MPQEHIQHEAQVPEQPTTNELLAAVHDLLLVVHMDLQRNYDMLYAIGTQQTEQGFDVLLEKHAQGMVFCPPIFLQDPEEPGDLENLTKQVIDLAEENDESQG